MKNQYFADINDYRKYGILRALAGNGALKTAICWMLTNNDQRSDGKFISYLEHPDPWRKYDPELYDQLAGCLSNPANRSVKWADENKIIPAASCYAELLEDDREKRTSYFDQFQSIAADSDLVFFDPDNGMEVKSVPAGRRGSQKYLYWPELLKTYNAGKSILVYQHFVRIKREVFTQQLVDRFCEHLPISEMITFTTANVLFNLIPQPRHQQFLAEQCNQISKQWVSQIKVNRHACPKIAISTLHQ